MKARWVAVILFLFARPEALLADESGAARVLRNPFHRPAELVPPTLNVTPPSLLRPPPLPLTAAAPSAPPPAPALPSPAPVPAPAPSPKPGPAAPPERAWKPKLKGVLLAGERSAADVGGTVVLLGEEFDGRRLASVDEERAVFERDGETWVLEMGRPGGAKRGPGSENAQARIPFALGEER
ncbi:MAG: hypothetical protein HY900_32950 [Deltaproteobacteria bacterium]|nr:hypothetical protein [Deltaproteobacteria bacterium]